MPSSASAALFCVTFATRLSALFATPRRHAGAGEADKRQQVLADSGGGLPHRLSEHCAHLPRLSRVGDWLGGNAVKQQVAEHGEPDTGPPRQHGDEIHEVLNGACSCVVPCLACIRPANAGDFAVLVASEKASNICRPVSLRGSQTLAASLSCTNRFLAVVCLPCRVASRSGHRQGNEKPTARRLQGDEQSPVAGRCRPICGSHPSRIRTESGPFAYQTRPGAQSRARLRPAEWDRNLTAPPCAQSSQPASVRSPPERHVHPARPCHRMPPVLDRQHPVKPQPGSSAPDDDVAVREGHAHGAVVALRAAEQEHRRQAE